MEAPTTMGIATLANQPIEASTTSQLVNMKVSTMGMGMETSTLPMVSLMTPLSLFRPMEKVMAQVDLQRIRLYFSIWVIVVTQLTQVVEIVLTRVTLDTMTIEKVR
jgi:hypothetical protein